MYDRLINTPIQMGSQINCFHVLLAGINISMTSKFYEHGDQFEYFKKFVKSTPADQNQIVILRQ